MKKRHSLFLMAALPLALMTSVQAQSSLAEIQRAGVIKIGTEGTYPPFTYHDKSGKLVGFDVEIGELIASGLGVKPQFVEGKWDGLIAGVDAKRYDLVLNEVAITPERLKKYDFSDPYITSKAVIVVHSDNQSIKSFADLKGRTILSTGKGTTPEYVLRYLLTKNGIDPDKDVKIEYYSEASEVTAQMAAARKDAIAVLPQPYVTAAQMKDSDLRVVLDLTREWNRVCDTQLITGVTVVRTEYAKQNPDVIAAFLTDYQKSVKAANEDIDGTAALCEEVGVVAKAALAKKALPKCNIVYRNGQEMKKDISAYLQVLYDASPAAVGGKLPDDNFYYTEPSVLRKVMAAIRNSAK